MTCRRWNHDLLLNFVRRTLSIDIYPPPILFPQMSSIHPSIQAEPRPTNTRWQSVESSFVELPLHRLPSDADGRDGNISPSCRPWNIHQILSEPSRNKINNSICQCEHDVQTHTPPLSLSLICGWRMARNFQITSPWLTVSVCPLLVTSPRHQY